MGGQDNQLDKAAAAFSNDRNLQSGIAWTNDDP